MPTSTEFANLCQSQIALLTQGMGAALSIIYLTEELTASPDTQLIPFVAHPEAALGWGEDQILSFLTQVSSNLRQQRLLASESNASVDASNSEQALLANPISAAYRSPNVLLPQQQIVLPLIYQERVMGLLVTARADRAWNEIEQSQIEHVAETLTAACVLDQRARWLAQDLQRQQLLEERKTDLFDDLLHQLRNPLTAVRTFGKLLVKRLRASDANRSVAENIVRESDRLQELLKQLDIAIDLDAKDLVPLLNASQGASQAEQLQDLSVLSEVASEVAPAVVEADARRPETRMLLGSAIDLQSHSVTEVLRPLLETATAIAQDRQLSLQTDIPADLPSVLIDVRALREVLNNLIDNALKYTPAHGQIYVGVRRQIDADSPQPVSESSSQVSIEPQPLQPSIARSGSFQVIVVADTGPGIPPEDLQHLFERHYRGVQAATNIPGTGLGLTIARDLVKQMQGDVQIFSPAAASGLVPAYFTQQSPDQSGQRAGTAAVVWLKEAD